MNQRFSSILLPLAAFTVAAILSALGARVAVSLVEDLSRSAVQEALADDGQQWADVLGDGLQVVIEGTAPNEAARFRAMSIAGRHVDASRVIDNISVVQRDDIIVPEFVVEILRSDSGISLIGLAPATTDRDVLTHSLSEIAGNTRVADLLELAEYPAPPDWRSAMTYATRVLRELPRAKISVRAGRVEISAIAESAAEKRDLERELAYMAPRNVATRIAITAPRPVVTPFTLRFTLNAQGGSFDACVAETFDDRDLMIEAARAIGFEGDVTCPIAIGAPDPEWSRVVSQAISTLGALGGGTLTVSDTDLHIIAQQGTDEKLFDTQITALADALPALYALEADLPAPPTPEGGEEALVASFTGTLSPEGLAQFRGMIGDDLMKITADNYAAARFGRSSLSIRTKVEPSVPSGWNIRVLTAIEALSRLKNGAVSVSPESVTLTGTTNDPEASTAISALFIEKFGQDGSFDIDIEYVEEIPEEESGPTPQECLASIRAITDETKILFDPGSATLTAETRPVIDDIAKVLRDCPELPLEVAGYTDSQGREVMNQQLSQERAEAVLTALRGRRVLTGSFRSIGYGEENPIADNDTEEGREANRRIEFHLYDPESEDGGRLETDATADSGEQDAAADDATGGAEETDVPTADGTDETTGDAPTSESDATAADAPETDTPDTDTPANDTPDATDSEG